MKYITLGLALLITFTIIACGGKKKSTLDLETKPLMEDNTDLEDEILDESDYINLAMEALEDQDVAYAKENLKEAINVMKEYMRNEYAHNDNVAKNTMQEVITSISQVIAKLDDGITISASELDSTLYNLPYFSDDFTDHNLDEEVQE